MYSSFLFIHSCNISSTINAPVVQADKENDAISFSSFCPFSLGKRFLFAGNALVATVEWSEVHSDDVQFLFGNTVDYRRVDDDGIGLFIHLIPSASIHINSLSVGPIRPKGLEDVKEATVELVPCRGGKDKARRFK